MIWGVGVWAFADGTHRATDGYSAALAVVTRADAIG